MGERSRRMNERRQRLDERFVEAERVAEGLLAVGNFAILCSDAPIERRGDDPYEQATWFSEWQPTRFALKIRRHSHHRPQTWESVSWGDIEGVADEGLAEVVARMQGREVRALLEAMQQRSPRAWGIQRRVGSQGLVLADWARDTVREWAQDDRVRVIGDHPH